MILGVILARGGSRRLPRKNIRLFAGRPLVAWTILAAQKATMLDRLVLSTEDSEIAEVARDYGCEVITRPMLLAGDTASPYDALLHAVDAVGGCETVVLLQPTSPLRTAEDIDGAINCAIGMDGPVASRARGAMVPNGATYVAAVEWLRLGGNWDWPNVIPHHMPPERSHDINTQDEFEAAERLVA